MEEKLALFVEEGSEQWNRIVQFLDTEVSDKSDIKKHLRGLTSNDEDILLSMMRIIRK